MRYRQNCVAMLLTTVVIFSGTLSASARIEQTNYMIIVDASSYSSEIWHDQTKYFHIRRALATAFQELTSSPAWGLNVGLRLFGDASIRERRNCTDYRLGAKLDWFDPGLISQVLENSTPKGINCLAYAILSSKDDFPKTTSVSGNYLVCIVSSRDECTEDELSAISTTVATARLAGVYIVGIDLSEENQAFMNSFFETITGQFFNAKSPEQLYDVVTRVMTGNIVPVSDPEHQPEGEKASLQN